MATPADLSIIIVNWNSVAFLRQCLSTAYSNNGHLHLEVVVVDNASNDGCSEMLAKEFPSVIFVQSPSNLGFSGANNLGFHHSTGQYLLFLNPDTELRTGAVERMLAALQNVPTAAIAGAKLLNSDGTIQTSCVRSFPTLLNEALDSDFLRDRFPRSSLWGMRTLFEQHSDPVAVEVISGAALMIRRETFERVGLFTTSYFMYAEDVDLCLKVKHAGAVSLLVPGALIVHHGGGSSNVAQDSSFAEVLLRESRFRYFLAHRGRLYAAAYRGVIASSAVMRLALLSLRWLVGARKRRHAFCAMKKWVRILRWTSGREAWARDLNPVRGIA